MISERDDKTLDNEPISEDAKTPYAEIEKGSYGLFLISKIQKRSIRKNVRKTKHKKWS